MKTTDGKRPPISKAEQVTIFRRDGWLCCWCKKPVIFAPAMKFLEREVLQSGYIGKTAYYHMRWTRKDAPLIDELGAVIDHVEAFSIGGSSNLENLVTACNKCNTKKSSASSEQWDARRPKKFVKGKFGEPQYWDGLSNLFIMLARKDLSVLTTSEHQWLAALTNETNG